MKRSITHILLNNLLIIAAACLLASCAPMPRTTTAPSLSAEAYLQMAANAQGPEKQDYLLKATNRYIQDRNPQAAQQILSQINVATLPPTYQLKSQLLQANIYVLNQKINQAQQLLANLQNNNPSLPQSEAIALHQLLAYVYQRQNLPLQSIQQRVQLENLLGNNQAAKNKNLQKIAQHLQGQSTQTLNQWLSETTDPTMQAWIQLALITKE